MNKLLTLLLFISISFASLQAQCTKPAKVGATSSVDGASAVVFTAFDVISNVSTTFEVQYKLATDTDWKVGGTATVTDPNSVLTLKNLTPCTKYTVRIRKICSTSPAIVTSDWVQESFATSGCPVTCVKVDQFGFVGIDSSSATGKWSQGGSGKYYIEYKIAADSVHVWSKDSTTEQFITLKGLKKCSRYLVRIITSCSTKFDTTALTVFETTCPTAVTCATPKNLTATVSADSVVTFTWANGTTVATPYVITVASTTGDFKKTYTTKDLSLVIKELPKCKSYFAAIVAQCDANHTSALSDYVNFTTKGCSTPVTCDAPSNLVVTVTNDTVVTLKWHKPSATSKTELEIYTVDGVLVKTAIVTDSFLIFKDLPKCHKFVARVKTQCDSTHLSSPSNYVDFATGICNITCSKVEHLSFAALDSTTAQGQWSAAGTGKYYVEYKIATDAGAVWLKDSSSTTSIKLTLLKKCTVYYVRVLSVCNNKLDTSELSKFQTACSVITSCEPPKNLVVTVANDTSATFTWVSPSNTSSNFTLYVYSVNGDFKKAYNVTGSTITIKDLPQCSSYNAVILTQCDATHSSGLSNTVDFKITHCGNSPTVCHKVERLAFTGLDSTTAQGQWTPAGTGKYYVEYKIATDPAAVWLKDSSITTSIKLTHLKKCSVYYARILSVCNGKLDTSELTKFETPCPKPYCPKPYGIRYTLAHDTVATIYWWINGPRNFVLQYQLLSNPTTTTWATVTGIDSFTVIKGLKPCSAYQIRLRANCDSINPEWLYYQFKTTGTCPVPTGCLKPVDIEAKFVTDSVFVFWNYPIPTLVSNDYEVQYKATTDANWSSTIAIKRTNFVALKGLTNCKSYTIRVRTICSATSTSEWAEYTFKAGYHCFVIDGGSTSDVKNSGSVNANSVLVSPNPGSSTDDPEVVFELTRASNVTLKMYNSVGSAVIINNLGKLDVGTYYQKINAATDLNAGFYFISVQAEGEAPTTARWVKL